MVDENIMIFWGLPPCVILRRLEKLTTESRLGEKLTKKVYVTHLRYKVGSSRRPYKAPEDDGEV